MSAPAARDEPSDRVDAARHPSPHRGRVGVARLTIGLMAAPVAWSLQLLLNASFAEWSCYPHDVPLVTPEWGGLHAALAAFNIVTLLVSLAGGVVAWTIWRSSGSERPGSAHALVASGDGRTRFMAMAGMMTSALFAVAIVLAMVNLSLSACGA